MTVSHSHADEDRLSFHRTATATISRLASGVVLFEPDRGVRIGRDQAVENNRAISTVAKDGPILLVARIAGIVYMNREARESSACYADLHYARVALVAEDAMSRMLATFFVGLNKPAVPTKTFSNLADAVTWLHGGTHH